MKKMLAIFFAMICLCFVPAAVKADYPDQAELERKAAQILDYLDLNNKSDYDIIFGIYDYICQTVEYDWDAAGRALGTWDGESLGYGQFAYEALCEEKAVCAGISEAVTLLLHKMDIPCVTIIGNIDGLGHAWNMAELDGKWYFMDATKDLGKSEYSLFLKGLADFGDHHSETELAGFTISDTSYVDTVSPERDTYGSYAFNKGFGDITIYSYTGTETDVVIPAAINGRPVKRLAQYFIEFNSTMETLTVSEGIERVDHLFIGHCERLRSISLPSTLQYAPNTDGFVSGLGLVDICGALETITVPDDSPFLCVIDGILYNREKTAILCCPAQNRAAHVQIPEGVKTIDNSTFEGNQYVQTVSLPDSVEFIGYWAFSGCSNLRTINIPENCTTIGQYAFSGTQLTSIHIPAATEAIIANVFPTTLRTITVDANNTHYYAADNVLFSYDGALVVYASGKPDISYTVPEGITAIVQNAFDSAFNLQTVVLPDGLIYIGESAFWDCFRLSKLFIPASVTTIGGDNILANVHGVFIYGEPGSAAEEWAISHEYNFHPTGAPWDLSGTCGDAVFWSLSEDGCLRIDGTGMMQEHDSPWRRYSNMIRQAIVSDGVTSIGGGMFYECRNLAQISIPSSVTRIGDSAFSECRSLPSVFIPESVTSIEDGAFSGCANLTQVIIPGNAAVFPDGIHVFNGSPNVVLYVNEGSGAHQYAITEGLRYRILGRDETYDFIVPRSVTAIGSEAFIGIAAGVVYIPETVTYIAPDAFDHRVTIIAPGGSYAGSWAAENGFSFISR